jgi:hypothetical protein
MRIFLIVLLIILIGCKSELKENLTDFNVTVFNLDDPNDSIGFMHWQKANLSFQRTNKIDTLFSQDTIPVGRLYYSDEQFLAYGYCYGEFGGVIIFQDQESKDSVYYLDCTCPVMIDKRDEGYYITESLAHMFGSGKVQFFRSPRELVSLHLDSLTTEWKIKKYPNLTEHEILLKLENQGSVLLDTVGLTFSIFFPNEGDNYLIFSDFDNTYLGLFTDNYLKTVDTILNFPTWRYNGALNDKINGYYHYNFRRSVSSGDIYAKGDSIIIAFKLDETTEKK